MPSEAEHRELAERNRATLPTLLVAAPEWAAVVAFYVAVHELERLAAVDGQHSATHKIQARYLSQHPEHRVVTADYGRLRSISEVVRYSPPAVCRAELPDVDAVRRLIDTSLAAVERYVNGRFPAAIAPLGEPLESYATFRVPLPVMLRIGSRGENDPPFISPVAGRDGVELRRVHFHDLPEIDRPGATGRWRLLMALTDVESDPTDPWFFVCRVLRRYVPAGVEPVFSPPAAVSPPPLP